MVKLRLKRMGSKFNAFYRIVAADARAPRDGRFIEELGYYNPHTKETFVDKQLREKWEKEGVVSSLTVKNLFKKYDKALSSDSNNGIVTLEIKPKKIKKQEAKVEELVSGQKSIETTETKKSDEVITTEEVADESLATEKSDEVTTTEEVVKETTATEKNQIETKD